MAARTPLTTITLGAASVADDLGYVALADLAQALGGRTEDYRVIGGHMVTVLALEIAFAAGIGPENFASGVRAESAELIRSLFNSRRNTPMTAPAPGQRLSA